MRFNDKLEFDYIALGHIHKRNFDDSMHFIFSVIIY